MGVCVLNVCTYMWVWVDACRMYFSFLSFFILASIDVDFVGSQLYFPEKVVICTLFSCYHITKPSHSWGNQWGFGIDSGRENLAWRQPCFGFFWSKQIFTESSFSTLWFLLKTNWSRRKSFLQKKNILHPSVSSEENSRKFLYKTFKFYRMIFAPYSWKGS